MLIRTVKYTSTVQKKQRAGLKSYRSIPVNTVHFKMPLDVEVFSPGDRYTVVHKPGEVLFRRADIDTRRSSAFRPDRRVYVTCNINEAELFHGDYELEVVDTDTVKLIRL